LPVLIVSVATLISGCLLPYLIQDWELGRREALHERMNGVVKFSAIGFTAIAAVTHIVSPVLFTWLLHGKYEDGLALMPWAFVQYTWFSLLAIAAKYLICIDRPRTGIWPLLAGLVSAVLLNILLVPWMGLTGVVMAMAVANGVALGFLIWIARRCGMKWDRTVLLAILLPVSMCLGGWAALGILTALVVGGWQTGWLIKPGERQQLYSAAADWWARHGERGPRKHALS
jgi:O-antigen/teichoic acid export membrane protein